MIEPVVVIIPAYNEARRVAGEAAVRRRFQRAKAEGDLPADSNPADLARYVVTISQGMAVQAASGASCEELQRVAWTAMRVWPPSRAASAPATEASSV